MPEISQAEAIYRLTLKKALKKAGHGMNPDLPTVTLEVLHSILVGPLPHRPTDDEVREQWLKAHQAKS